PIFKVCAALLHEGHLRDPICHASESVSSRVSAPARKNLWRFGELGIRQQQRSGHRNRPQCRNLPVEFGSATPIAGTNRGRGGLLGESQHSPPVGGCIRFDERTEFSSIEHS